MDVIGIKENDICGTHVTLFEPDDVSYFQLSPRDFFEVASSFQSSLKF
jgi:hypothetical protein